jgi:hypothetical protein
MLLPQILKHGMFCVWGCHDYIKAMEGWEYPLPSDPQRKIERESARACTCSRHGCMPMHLCDSVWDVLRVGLKRRG